MYVIAHVQCICKHLTPDGDHGVVLGVLRLSFFAKFNVV